MSARHPQWKEIDETLTAYITVSEAEQIVQNKDSRKPVSIVVPQTYATMEILLTYLTAALLEPPLFRFEGTAPEDIMGAILLEKVIDQQTYFSKAALRLHTMFRDGLAYGMGMISPQWTVENAVVEKMVSGQAGLLDTLMGRQPAEVRMQFTEVKYEGNKLENVDPYRFLPDPSVSIDRLQEGEFVGWITTDNVMGLLKEEKNSDEFFNCMYLKHLGTATSQFCKTDPSGRTTKTGIGDYIPKTSSTSRVDIIYMYVDIIPRDWKLPGSVGNKDGKYPEPWLFAVAGDEVVIQARPLNLNHGRKPLVAFAPDYDGYSISPVSRIETEYGLQHVLNFLFNSHIANVRKAINDMLIVDPSLINMDDLKDPEPGKLIRMRRAVWGRGVENAVKQLAVTDITRTNMNDAQLVMELMKNVSGSLDSISGVRRKSSERVTATEIQGDRSSGLSRLEKISKVAGWMALQDLGYMMASHTQQLMSQETYVRITGQWQDVLAQEYGIQANRIKVAPEDLLVGYDVVVKDGSIPGGNFADVWVQLLPQLAQHPELMQRFDLTRIVKHILRSLGAKDVNQFDRKIQAQVMPNEQVQQQAQAGNLLPMVNGLPQMGGAESGTVG
jgi:hypothetical protein